MRFAQFFVQGGASRLKLGEKSLLNFDEICKKIPIKQQRPKETRSIQNLEWSKGLKNLQVRTKRDAGGILVNSAS